MKRIDFVDSVSEYKHILTYTEDGVTERGIYYGYLPTDIVGTDADFIKIKKNTEEDNMFDEVIVSYVAPTYEVKGVPSDFVTKQETEFDNNITLNFSEVTDIDNVFTALCVDSVMRSTTKAQWLELTLKDKYGRFGNAKLFTNDNVDFRNSYVVVAINKNSYGFNISSCNEKKGIETPENNIDYIIDYLSKQFEDSESPMINDHIIRLVSLCDYGVLGEQLAYAISLAKVTNRLYDFDIKKVCEAMLIKLYVENVFKMNEIKGVDVKLFDPTNLIFYATVKEKAFDPKIIAIIATDGEKECVEARVLRESLNMAKKMTETFKEFDRKLVNL